MATKKTKTKTVQKSGRKEKKTAAKTAKPPAGKPSAPSGKRKPVAVKPAPKKAPAKKKTASAGTSKAPPAKTRSGKSVPSKRKGTAAKAQKAVRQRNITQPMGTVTEEERNRALKRVLIAKKQELFKEVKNEISKYIKGETRQLVDTALDDGDWSIVDLSEDISFRHLSSHRETLLKIDEALRKLDEGTYGSCEDCGEEISEARLKILPFAIYCIDCQEKREKLEEMERREGLIG